MDRATLAEFLTQAERHVALGRVHIARQREIVERIRATHQDPTQAIELLAIFEQLLETHIADRDRLVIAVAAAHP